jgi:hypothetical protein
VGLTHAIGRDLPILLYREICKTTESLPSPKKLPSAFPLSPVPFPDPANGVYHFPQASGLSFH